MFTAVAFYNRPTDCQLRTAMAADVTFELTLLVVGILALAGCLPRLGTTGGHVFMYSTFGIAILGLMSALIRAKPNEGLGKFVHSLSPTKRTFR